MKIKTNRLIVVLGMHRSGTSAITKGLELLGVGLGNNLFPPRNDNPKGFWEDKEIIEINDDLLTHFGSAADRLKSTWDEIEISSKIAELHLRAIKLVSLKLSEGDGIWGFKDPRTCRLLFFWKKVFLEVGCDVSYIIQIRNPISVVESLEKRDGINQIRSYYLWLEHVLISMLHTEDSLKIIVDYDELLANPYFQLARISTKLQLPLPAQNSTSVMNYVTNFLDSGLRHTKYTENDLASDSRAPKIILETYNFLNNLTKDLELLENPNIRKKITELNHRLNDLSPAFAYINTLEDLLLMRNDQVKVIDEQVKVIDEQSKVIDEQSKAIKSIYRSSSWRITKPLRFIKQFIHKLM